MAWLCPPKLTWSCHKTGPWTGVASPLGASLQALMWWQVPRGCSPEMPPLAPVWQQKGRMSPESGLPQLGRTWRRVLTTAQVGLNDRVLWAYGWWRFPWAVLAWQGFMWDGGTQGSSQGRSPVALPQGRLYGGGSCGRNMGAGGTGFLDRKCQVTGGSCLAVILLHC